MPEPVPKPAVVQPGYRSQSKDTRIEIDRFEFALLRQRTPEQRLQMASKLIQGARRLSLHCLKQQFNQLSPAQFARKVAVAWRTTNNP